MRAFELSSGGQNWHIKTTDKGYQRMKHRSQITSLLSSRNLQKVFREGSAVAGLIALSATLGCSGAEGSGDGSTQLGTQTEQLVYKPGNPQPLEWKAWSVVGAPSTAIGEAAICTPHAPHSWVMFTRDTSNFIQGQSNLGGNPSVWAKYGSTVNPRKLGGRPACGFVSEAGSPFPFILVAKGANAPDGSPDKRLFWSKGNWTANTSWPPPSAVTAFAALDNTQYSTNGNPAVAAYNGQLVVVYLDDNGQLRGNYWTGSGFSGTLIHPALPTGWTGVGTPTIAYAENWAQKFVIFVRVKNAAGTVFKLYETFFDTNHFAAAYGGSTGVYQAVTLPPGAPVISSDPAYEYDRNDVDGFEAGTLYYRSGTKIYQMSASNAVDQFNTSTFKAVLRPDGTWPSASGNPVVNGGTQNEAGSHWVLVRGGTGGNTLYMAESYQDSTLNPN